MHPTLLYKTFTFPPRTSFHSGPGRKAPASVFLRNLEDAVCKGKKWLHSQTGSCSSFVILLSAAPRFWVQFLYFQ